MIIAALVILTSNSFMPFSGATNRAFNHNGDETGDFVGLDRYNRITARLRGGGTQTAKLAKCHERIWFMSRFCYLPWRVVVA